MLFLGISSSDGATWEERSDIPYALMEAVGYSAAADYLLALHRLVEALAWQPDMSVDDAADGWDADLSRLGALQALAAQSPQSWLLGVPHDALDAYLATIMQSPDLQPHEAHAATLMQASLADLFGPNVRGMASASLEPARAWALGNANEIWISARLAVAERPGLARLLRSRLEPLLDDAAASTHSLDSASASPVALLESRVAALLSSELVDRRDSAVAAGLARHAESTGAMREADLSLLSLVLAVERLAQGSVIDFQATLFNFIQHVAEVPQRAPPPDDLSRVVTALGHLQEPLIVQLESVDLALASMHRESLQLLDKLARREAAPADPDPEPLLRLAQMQARLLLYSDQLVAFLKQPAARRLKAQMQDCLTSQMPDSDGPVRPMPVEDFANCVDELVLWATETAEQPELSGDPDGPFGPVYLRRELLLDTWQRINYWRGYIADRYPRSCATDLETVPNPMVWALSVRALRWLIATWPAYGAQPVFRARMDELARTGEAIADALRRQTRCEADAPSPMMAGLADYENRMGQIDESLVQARDSFRTQRLKPEADVNFALGAEQLTNYRPPQLMVQPCTAEGSCGMAKSLSVSRALLGLFPAPLLIADQLGMGELSLCYDNVGWTERRAAPARVEETRTANYFGKLRFDLFGNYSGASEPVFIKRLVGTTEYQYLFGENAPAVAEDACPRARVGTRIDSTLSGRRFSLLPRRLSYITAARTDPGRVFDEHWETGEEWRDRLAAGQADNRVSISVPDGLTEEVDLRLASLHRELEGELVGAMIGGRSRAATPELRQLAGEFRNLETARHTLRSTGQLFAGRSLVYREPLRATVLGRAGLASRPILAERLPATSEELMVRVRDRHTHAAAHWTRHANRVAASPGADVPPLISRTLLEIEALRALTRPDPASTLASTQR